MSVSRLVATGFVFACAAVAWFALGSSLVVRTGENDARITKEVELLWGGPHVQVAPHATIARPGPVVERLPERDAEGKVVGERWASREGVVQVAAPLSATRADVRLSVDHRRRGLLWYDTYAVTFRGAYAFRNPDAEPRTMTVAFAFPARSTIFDDVEFKVNGRAAAVDGDLSKGLTARVDVPANADLRLEVGYRSRGLGTWTYAFAEDGVAQVRDAELTMVTDFARIDFPAGTIAANEKVRDGRGWRLRWAFRNMVTGQRLGMDLPNRLNPGPLAARITFFAPVSLLFFLAVMVMLGVVRGENLHPMNYVFVAAAFFAFHLLLAYLVDHVSVHVAFVIAALTSVALVVSYLRAITGMRRTLLEAALAQVVFLVLFSYAFFFEGYTGLTVTVGAVLTLFVLMQATASVNWTRVFAEGVPQAEVVS